MKRKLTRGLIENAAPKAAPYEIRDTALSGLLLRVQPSGVKSFIVEWQRGKRSTIGRHPVMTLAAANTAALKLLSEVAEHGAPLSVIDRHQRDQTLTFGDYIRDQYAPHVLATAKRGKDTIAAINKQFSDLFDLKLQAITRAKFDQFKVRRLNAGKSPVTVNRDLDRLKAALGQAVKWELIERNPLAGVKRIKRGIEHRIRYLSDAERDALHAALDAREAEAKAKRARFNEWRVARHMEPLPAIVGYSDHLVPMVVLALNTGMRRGELTQITWADVDFRTKVLTVRAGYAKSGKDRHIPLNSTAIGVLAKWREQHPSGRLFPVASVAKAWASLMAAAGIENFRFHDCRHDFASRLVMAGVSLNTVRELLGHGDIKMTLRYAHLAPAHNAAAVELLAFR